MLSWYSSLLDGYSIFYQHLSRLVILKSIHFTWTLSKILCCTIPDIIFLSKLLSSLWHCLSWVSIIDDLWKKNCVFKFLPICIGSWELLYLYTWKFCKQRLYNEHIMNQLTVMRLEWVMYAILWSYGEGETTYNLVGVRFFMTIFCLLLYS